MGWLKERKNKQSLSGRRVIRPTPVRQDPRPNNFLRWTNHGNVRKISPGCQKFILLLIGGVLDDAVVCSIGGGREEKGTGLSDDDVLRSHAGYVGKARHVLSQVMTT